MNELENKYKKLEMAIAKCKLIIYILIIPLFLSDYSK